TSTFQVQNILHVVKTSRLTLQPQRRTHGAFSKRHPAARLVGNLNALALGGEQNGVVTHHITGADGFEADFLAGAFAGEAFAAVDGAFFEVSAEGVGYHFAHAQGGAGGGVFFVAVVGFDDFYVVVVTQSGRCRAQEVEDDVDANAHVGGEDHRGGFCRQGQLFFFSIGHAGSADDDHFAVGAAKLRVFQGQVREGEVHQYVEVVFDVVQAAGHFYAGFADAGHFAGVGANQAAARLDNGGAQLEALGTVDGFDQHFTHAPGGADDCYPHLLYPQNF